MTYRELIENLRKLTESNEFAQSLVRQFDNNGILSDKQWHWAARLVREAEETKNPQQRTIEVDLSGIIDLFDHAVDHLKFPKIRIATEDDERVLLVRSGERSKLPGSVVVTDGGSYEDNVCYGRITRDGKWHASRSCTTEIAELLTSIADHPARAAAEYGQREGRCCFCHKGLEDERSTTVGYGPTCAKNFGLEWGAKADLI